MTATIDSPPSSASVAVDPSMALELRLRHLEAHIGPISSSSHVTSSSLSPILLRASAAQKDLEEVTQGNSSLRRFVSEFDANRRILSAGFRPKRRESRTRDQGDDAIQSAEKAASEQREASSASASTATQSRGSSFSLTSAPLSVEEQILLVVDNEPEMRALERIFLECQALDQRGISGAGRLSEYEQLQPGLDAAWENFKGSVAPLQDQLEERILTIMERYQNQIDQLSRLFVGWDEALKGMEDKVTRLERQKRAQTV